MRTAVVFAALARVANALNNGFTLPAMGYSSWNDCSSFRDNGPNGWCWDSEAHIRNVTRFMIDSGLAKLGYNRINVDEGWLKGRNANGVMYEDLSKFPSGMKGLGDWIKAQETAPGSGEMMHYGLYSCRGTCQCGTGTYSAPGSHGYEAADVDWMVAAGADYLKIDSCCGNQDHAVAFSDYAKFRDAMNATGKQVWFSLCGWEAWYSPPDPSLNYLGGGSLGNSWRIAGDGSGWGPLTNCLNTQAGAAPYVGLGAWADPDLLIGPQVYVGGQSDQQARAQFTMWSLAPTNLLISQNVLAWSDYAMETYSNSELVGINQDPLGSAARRIVGGDLSFPCGGGAPGALASVVAADCKATDVSQQWDIDAATGEIKSRAFPGGVLDAFQCGTADGTVVSVFTPDSGKGSCAGKNQRWKWNNGGSVTNDASGACLDIFDWVGPTVDTWTCNGGTNQNFTYNSNDGTIRSANGGTAKHSKCIAAVAAAPTMCTNVWGRVLSGGEYALGFVNNFAGAVNVTCDASCFAGLNLTASVTSLKVRDLWAHADIETLSAPFSFTSLVEGGGFATAYKLTPA